MEKETVNPNEETTSDETTDTTETGNTSESEVNEGTEGGEETPPEDDDTIVAETDEGKRIVSAFQKRIDKLVSERNSSRQLLESLKNDPVARQEFLDGLGIKPTGDNTKEEVQESDDLDTFVGALDEKARPHYETMFGALGARFERILNQRLENLIAKEIEPIKLSLGQNKLEQFEKSNPDFAKYRVQAESIMRDGRAKRLEDAYILASHEAKFKAAKQLGAQGEAERRKKINTRPNPKGNSNLNGKSNESLGLMESIKKAASQTGY